MSEQTLRDWLEERESSIQLTTPLEYAEQIWLVKHIAHYGERDSSVPTRELVEESEQDLFDSLPSKEITPAPDRLPPPLSSELPSYNAQMRVQQPNASQDRYDDTGRLGAVVGLDRFKTSPVLSPLQLGRGLKGSALIGYNRSVPVIDVDATLAKLDPLSRALKVEIKYPRLRLSRLVIIEDHALTMLPWRGEGERFAEAARSYASFDRVYDPICLDFNRADVKGLGEILLDLELSGGAHLLVIIISDAIGGGAASGTVTEALRSLPDGAQVVWVHPQDRRELKMTEMWRRAYPAQPRPLHRGEAVSPLCLSLSEMGLSPLRDFSPRGGLTNQERSKWAHQLRRAGQPSILGFSLPEPGVAVDRHTAQSDVMYDLDELLEELEELRYEEPRRFRQLQLISLLPGEVLGVDLLLRLCDRFTPSLNLRLARADLSNLLSSGFLEQVSKSDELSDLRLGLPHESLTALLYERASSRLHEAVGRFILDYAESISEAELASLNPVLRVFIRHEQVSNQNGLHELVGELKRSTVAQRERLLSRLHVPSVEISISAHKEWKSQVLSGESFVTDQAETERDERDSSSISATADASKESETHRTFKVYHPVFPKAESAIDRSLADSKIVSEILAGRSVIKLPIDHYNAEGIKGYADQALRETDEYLAQDEVSPEFQETWLISSSFSYKQYKTLAGPHGQIEPLVIDDDGQVQSVVDIDPEFLVILSLAVWRGMDSIEALFATKMLIQSESVGFPGFEFWEVDHTNSAPDVIATMEKIRPPLFELKRLLEDGQRMDDHLNLQLDKHKDQIFGAQSKNLSDEAKATKFAALTAIAALAPVTIPVIAPLTALLTGKFKGEKPGIGPATDQRVEPMLAELVERYILSSSEVERMMEAIDANFGADVFSEISSERIVIDGPLRERRVITSALVHGEALEADSAVEADPKEDVTRSLSETPLTPRQRSELIERVILETLNDVPRDQGTYAKMKARIALIDQFRLALTKGLAGSELLKPTDLFEQASGMLGYDLYNAHSIIEIKSMRSQVARSIERQLTSAHLSTINRFLANGGLSDESLPTLSSLRQIAKRIVKPAREILSVKKPVSQESMRLLRYLHLVVGVLLRALPSEDQRNFHLFIISDEGEKSDKLEFEHFSMPTIDSIESAERIIKAIDVAGKIAPRIGGGLNNLKLTVSISEIFVGQLSLDQRGGVRLITDLKSMREWYPVYVQLAEGE